MRGGFSVKGMTTDGSAYVTHFVITVGPFEHSYIEQKEEKWRGFRV